MSAKDYTYRVRLQIVQEALKPENRNSISYIAEKYGVKDRTLSRWIQRYNEYGEEGLKTNWKTKVRDQRIKELERENAELREEAEILKKLRPSLRMPCASDLLLHVPAQRGTCYRKDGQSPKCIRKRLLQMAQETRCSSYCKRTGGTRSH